MCPSLVAVSLALFFFASPSVGALAESGTAPVKLAWTQDLGGEYVAPPSFDAQTDLVLVPTVSLQNYTDFPLVALSLASGALKWSRLLTSKEGGCSASPTTMPFGPSSFMGNGQLVANFMKQIGFGTRCLGFAVLDSKTGDVKSTQAVGPGFTYTINVGGLLYIARLESNLSSTVDNTIFLLTAPTYALSAPVANYTWPVADVVKVTLEPNLLISPQRLLLVVFQASSRGTVLVGLNPRTLDSLWTATDPMWPSSVQLSGPLRDLILFKASRAELPYNTSVQAYDAFNGHLLWQFSKDWSSYTTMDLHGVVMQGKGQLMCATFHFNGARTLQCHDPVTGRLVFSKDLASNEVVMATYDPWLIVKATHELLALDPFAGTTARTIPVEGGGPAHVLVADDQSFLLLQYGTRLAKWTRVI